MKAGDQEPKVNLSYITGSRTAVPHETVSNNKRALDVSVIEGLLNLKYNAYLSEVESIYGMIGREGQCIL